MSAACDYCGLPVPAGGRAAQPSAGPVYCCYGCSLASAMTGAGDEGGPSRGLMTRLGLAIFFSMNVMVFTFFLWSQDAAAASQSATIFYDLARYICLLFTAPVILLLAGPLAADAWREVSRGRPSLSMLLVAGVLAAFLYSADSVFRTGGHVYFEVSCSVLVAVTLGKWLEATGKLQTTAALRSLEKLLPEEVRRIDQGCEVRIPREQVRVGDVLRVLPGERIAVDGVLLDQGAALDEQMVTGESVPVQKLPGSNLYSGTMNLQSLLLLRATAAADAGFVARIIQSVTEAAAAKDRFTRLAETLAQWFFPLVLLAAAAAMFWHWTAGNWEQGLLAALSVVVIACPCALGLATPMAIWAAFGRAAQQQVLIHHGDSFTELARVRAICFDKTGTLTTGQVRLACLTPAPGTPRHLLLRAAAALASQSTHPLSQAIVVYAREHEAFHPGNGSVSHVLSVPGLGVTGRLAALEAEILLGNERLLANHGISIPPEMRWQSPGESCGPQTWIAWGGRLQGVIHFQEELRREAPAAVRQLKQLGIEPMMLTGDGSSRARVIGDALDMEVRGDLLPEEKLDVLRDLQRRVGCVAMVGDGINDAPALAAADIGIALGSGADISRDCAGLCLMTNDLSRLPWLIDLARQTVRTIRWNLVWAFAYNFIGIGIAAAGWLHPAVAAIAMVASSLMVVTNSLRLASEAPAQVPQSKADLPRTSTDNWRLERVDHGLLNGVPS